LDTNISSPKQFDFTPLGSTMKRPGATRDEHKKICQACLSRFLVLRPLDCKDSARAFPKREAREKPKGILGVSTLLFILDIVTEII
jgi:hypothetical protein